VKDREYIEEIIDPVTGEVLTLRATTEAELDAAVAERFGMDREDGEIGTPDLHTDHTREGDDAYASDRAWAGDAETHRRN
jgi:hypothetical protein